VSDHFKLAIIIICIADTAVSLFYGGLEGTKHQFNQTVVNQNSCAFNKIVKFIQIQLNSSQWCM